MWWIWLVWRRYICPSITPEEVFVRIEDWRERRRIVIRRGKDREVIKLYNKSEYQDGSRRQSLTPISKGPDRPQFVGPGDGDTYVVTA